MGRYFSATDISASGLAAERFRMEVVANNLANAHTTRTSTGGPYRRQEVLFSSIVDRAAGSAHNARGLGGVQIAGVQTDPSELPRVFNPGHPDADGQGYVDMPNVVVANEMVDLITASRAYEANLRSLRSFQSMTENALSLLRSVWFVVDVSAISRVEGLPSVGGIKSTNAPQGRTFSRLVAEQLNDVNLEQLQADNAVSSFANGETDNVHDVVLAVAKADLAFRMVLEIRNRLVESYQEILRMQV